MATLGEVSTTSEPGSAPAPTPALRAALDGGVIDTMVTVPSSREAWRERFAGLIKDEGSDGLDHPAGYMFKDLPTVDGDVDYLAYLLAEMDRFGIRRALLPVARGDAWGRRATDEHPDRFSGFALVDPHQGADARRVLAALWADGHAAAAAMFPSGLTPPIEIDAAPMYPVYALCCELDIPVFVNVGVPGPRVPMASQHPGGLDRVCDDFPDLRIVTRHGGEPWEALLVKLMVKWPNLHYSTSAFAPRYYPAAIVEYANTRGREQVIYGGYFPSGLTLDRIFGELPAVGFRDDVWEPFLRGNAARVLGLG